ncbi:hypothetical protein XELAEV_18028718mg [Xenopus laevis]|uniref:Uncharacterized protein n=1 Tax=Xenopus laevis TaxID=8355 RepID=A0A974HGX5_XENLA|nr:hypothetical protein XELAEV_18028718mg [Xenopus laevis]
MQKDYDRSDRTSHHWREHKQNQHGSSEYSSNVDHQRHHASAVQHQEAEDLSHLNCQFPSDTYKDKKGRLKRSKENIDEDDESENSHQRDDKNQVGSKSKTFPHKMFEGISDDKHARVEKTQKYNDNEGTHKVKQRTHGNNKADYESEENSNEGVGAKEVKHGYTNNTHSNKHNALSQDMNDHKLTHKEITQSDIKQRRDANDKERSPRNGKDRSLHRGKGQEIEEEREKSKPKHSKDVHSSACFDVQSLKTLLSFYCLRLNYLFFH